METRELLSPRGVPVATYVHAERDGLPYVHQLVPRPGVATDAVARAAAERLAGLLVDTELPGLRESLEAAGAQVRHRAELMQVSLAGAEGADPGVEPPHPPPRVPEGVTIRRFGGTVPPELGAVSVAAYPPGHPDHGAQDAAAALALLRPLVEGGPGWGRRDAARLAVRDADGQAVGAAIIADFTGRPPHGGPHLVQLFRLPGDDLRGLGAALLDAALDAARRDGCATVGLQVNADNPARRLYLSRGFAPHALSVALQMPGVSRDPAVVSPHRPTEP